MKEKKEIIADEDYDFVSLCKKGDADAFEVLVKRHQKRMFNIAYRMLGDFDEAANLVQDAFLAAYRGIKDFKGEALFSTWLYRIVINLSRNRLQQLKVQLRREPFSLDDPLPSDGGQIKMNPASSGPSVLEMLEKKDIQQKVQGCISALGIEFKEVLVLRDIQGLPYEEISEMLRIPEGTVKSRLFRAREALKDCLKQFIGDL